MKSPSLRAVWLIVLAAFLSLGAAAHSPVASGPSRRVIIRYRPQHQFSGPATATSDQTAQALAKLGLVVVPVPPEAVSATLAALQQDPAVEFAQPAQAVTLQVTPDDPFLAQQYGLSKTQALQAWDITTGSISVTIAIIDTGIDLTHPDLQGKIISGTSFITGTTAQDDNGHGTHVAGIAAAIANNAVGVAGLSWGARLMPIKVLDQNGNGDDAAVAAGIVWAADHGAQVINLSLGGSCPSPVMALAATYAYTMGVTVVAAAGNSGGAGVMCPAASPHVIAVAATNVNNQRASFSSYGPEVALAAPGVGILSTVPTGACHYCAASGYNVLSGTSMAAPFVTGAAALLASLPQFDTPDKRLAVLDRGALDLGPVCRDPYYGAGLLQIQAALQLDPLTATPRVCYHSWLPLFGR